jgi:hypothetical protein
MSDRISLLAELVFRGQQVLQAFRELQDKE